uniref:Fungal lipase-type domain-containing protein n=1 Tax=Rhizophagus irregularis (strain DAOM 181602 / DAOM 197198 / MUCL 43194) TaxID=747089 RepID=U9TBG9_RHIID
MSQIIFLFLLFFTINCVNSASLKVVVGQNGYMEHFVPNRLNAMVGDEIKFVIGNRPLNRLTEADGMGSCKRSSKPDAFFAEISETQREVTFPLNGAGKFFVYDIMYGCIDDNAWFVVNVEERPAGAPPPSTPNEPGPDGSTSPSNPSNPSSPSVPSIPTKSTLSPTPTPTQSSNNTGSITSVVSSLIVIGIIVAVVYFKCIKRKPVVVNNFNNNSNNNNNNNNNYTFENIEHKIRDMIGQDEEPIKEQIKEFDLNFTSISELNTDDGGSFCGMFWSIKENFIIISFKGTTPTNFAEWLGNLTFQCVDARNYLFGQVHRGFYNYLFPIDEESAGKNYPCQKIIETINCKAKSLKNINGKKVNLWITGHSLGGALATLFYARLLNINYTHDSWELQGAITFASPAVGDINFSTQLASLINDPRNLAKPLWRIVLNDDFVPKMPYRACNKRMRKYGYHYNVLMNYAQVGDKITFYGGDHDPTSIKDFFNHNENIIDNNITEHINRLKSFCKNYCKEKKNISFTKNNGLEVWKFGSLEVWKFGSLEVWKFGSLEVWKLESLEVGKLGSWEDVI